MKFTSLYLAKSYRDRAFTTTGTSLRIVMHDCPFYIVCSPKEASQLIKQGYQLAE